MPLQTLSDLEELDELMSSSPTALFILYFHASWCGPCKRVAPSFEALAEEFQKVFFISINVDRSEEISDEYKISSTPTFVFVKSSERVDIYLGTEEKALRDLILKHDV